jgi:hypothetical protein
MQNFIYVASIQTDLDSFLTFFQAKLRNFRKIFRKNQEIQNSKFQVAKDVHAKFQQSSFNPDGLRKTFDIFPRKFKKFQEIL